MKTSSLLPQYILPFDKNHGLYVLWFKKSNSYTIVSNTVLNLMKTFLHKTKADFLVYLNAKGYSNKMSAQYYLEMGQWLEQVNFKSNEPHLTYERKYLKFKKEYTDEVSFVTYYLIYGKYIQVNFPDTRTKNLVNPQLAHYEVTYSRSETYHVFDIVCDTDNTNLALYLNRTFLFSTRFEDMHVFLGKLSLQIISILYSKNEENWLATFHASTVVKNEKAIMCIGKSGSGKSTLCALLNQNGYDVIADDMTPMLASNLKVYRNPSAISIKEGAFNVLKPHVRAFNSLTTINSFKGIIKFLPISGDSKNSYSYNCDKVVLVKFDKNNEEASLDILPKSRGLEILISESWLSNEEKHALQFLNWIETVTFYELTYAKTEDAINCFNELEMY